MLSFFSMSFVGNLLLQTVFFNFTLPAKSSLCNKSVAVHEEPFNDGCI